MIDHEISSRRKFFIKAGSFLAASAVTLSQSPAIGFTIGMPLPPAEDLTQEHGVLERIILAYETIASRFEHHQGDPDGCLKRTTAMIVKYFQGHHERVEELMIFPALTKANAHPQLTATLVSQHRSGHELTDAISRKMEHGKLSDSLQNDLVPLLRSYTRMFRPHIARENTVVFPSLREVMTPAEYQEFSNKVNALENKMLPASLSDILAELVAIETALGIADLSSFTAVVANPH
jgi:hemerythrin-like domain-containing protein